MRPSHKTWLNWIFAAPAKVLLDRLAVLDPLNIIQAFNLFFFRTLYSYQAQCSIDFTCLVFWSPVGRYFLKWIRFSRSCFIAIAPFMPNSSKTWGMEIFCKCFLRDALYETIWAPFLLYALWLAQRGWTLLKLKSSTFVELERFPDLQSKI